MYCLKIVIARPRSSYKSPSVDVIVEHYKTEREALAFLLKTKKQFIDYYELCCTIEQFDIKLTKGFLYNAEDDTYDSLFEFPDDFSTIDIPPFDWEIFKI